MKRQIQTKQVGFCENERDKETKESVIEIAALRFEKQLTREIAGLRSEMHEEIAGLRVDVTTEIQKCRSDTIKWMFIFWIGQIGVLTGIVLAVFN